MKYILGTEKDVQIFSGTDFSSGINLLSKTAVSRTFEHLAINITKVPLYPPIDPFPNTKYTGLCYRVPVCIFCVHSKLSQRKQCTQNSIPQSPVIGIWKRAVC